MEYEKKRKKMVTQVREFHKRMGNTKTNKQNKQTNTDFLQYMFCWGPPVIMLFCSFIFRKWG